MQCVNTLITDSVQSDEQPFAALSEADLQQTKRAAEARLAKQRIGVVDVQQGNSDDGVGETEGIRLAPKSSGPATMGPDWDGPDQALNKQGRGLVSRANGLMYVCEYDECMENWRTEVLPQEQASVLVEMYKLHITQYHEKKKSSEEEEKCDKEQANYEEAVKLRSIEAHNDNRLDILSPARFFPMPLQYQEIAKQQPAKQTPVWARLLRIVLL